MIGVVSMAETLVESYHKLNEDQRLDAAKVILQSSQSLKAFDDNIATLVRLGKPHYELHKEKIDLSDFLYDRVQTCRRLYEKNKEDCEFILNIAEKITINADKNYLTQLLDNLIINSITYCKKGKINITLHKNQGKANLIISDEGVGIPVKELYEIFEPFTVSSRTKIPSGGRGVGLATCKRILEVHGRCPFTIIEGFAGKDWHFEAWQ